MENYIRRENVALFKRRLTEALDDAHRKIILKLIADEEAKAPKDAK
jgi:hypothetical protein